MSRVQQSFTSSGLRTPGKSAGPFTVGDEWHQTGLAESRVVEEPQGTDSLVVQAPGGRLLEEMKLESTDVLGVQFGGRSLEMVGEADHASYIGMDGFGRVVADTQVVDESLS
jgi:hypothetical protein